MNGINLFSASLNKNALLKAGRLRLKPLGHSTQGF